MIPPPLQQSEARGWDQSVLIYNRSGTIPVQQGCFAFMFTNVGNDTAFVCNMVLFPSATPTTAIGDSRTLSGHKNDLYMGNITLSFAGVGNNPSVEIVQLYYLE